MGRAKIEAQHELRQDVEGVEILLRQKHHVQGSRQEIRIQIRFSRQDSTIWRFIEISGIAQALQPQTAHPAHADIFSHAASARLQSDFMHPSWTTAANYRSLINPATLQVGHCFLGQINRFSLRRRDFSTRPWLMAIFLPQLCRIQETSPRYTTPRDITNVYSSRKSIYFLIWSHALEAFYMLIVFYG